MIKVLVIGKYNSIVHWTENTVEAFKQSGCKVDYFALNGDTAIQSLYFKLAGKMRGSKLQIVTDSLYKKLNAFKPDLIVFVMIASNWLPESVFQMAAETCPKAKTVAWVGDKFTQEEGVFANHVDWVFCTDTAFIDAVHEYKLSSPASYLPLAVDPAKFHPMNMTRSNAIIYVANNTVGRGKMVSTIERPVTLYGKGWSKLKDSPHIINAYRLPYAKLPQTYASCRAVLNVKNEKNVINGLSQRSFEPYGCMTPVLNDDMQDIDLCFEAGKEILVYHSMDELHELYDRLVADATFASSIGQAGYKRVMAEHTYAHRAQSILAQIGVQ
ncbi:MAG: glycosyltransferase [Sulfuriferula sp.]|nr:glycosyltransferase [Sulfuriferula sp.]